MQHNYSMNTAPALTPFGKEVRVDNNEGVLTALAFAISENILDCKVPPHKVSLQDQILDFILDEFSCNTEVQSHEELFTETIVSNIEDVRPKEPSPNYVSANTGLPKSEGLKRKLEEQQKGERKKRKKSVDENEETSFGNFEEPERDETRSYSCEDSVSEHGNSEAEISESDSVSDSDSDFSESQEEGKEKMLVERKVGMKERIVHKTHACEDGVSIMLKKKSRWVAISTKENPDVLALPCFVLVGSIASHLALLQDRASLCVSELATFFLSCSWGERQFLFGDVCETCKLHRGCSYAHLTFTAKLGGTLKEVKEKLEVWKKKSPSEVKDFLQSRRVTQKRGVGEDKVSMRIRVKNNVWVNINTERNPDVLALPCSALTGRSFTALRDRLSIPVSELGAFFLESSHENRQFLYGECCNGCQNRGCSFATMTFTEKLGGTLEEVKERLRVEARKKITAVAENKEKGGRRVTQKREVCDDKVSMKLRVKKNEWVIINTQENPDVLALGCSSLTGRSLIPLVDRLSLHVSDLAEYFLRSSIERRRFLFGECCVGCNNRGCSFARMTFTEKLGGTLEEVKKRVEIWEQGEKEVKQEREIKEEGERKELNS
eukprot:TRINITY_DN9214_c0_g1_i1.p1 TRINITY_DN9214_c0_g1~~TRINITY_DN9214_c0_g1_i1.p1  ORF type:complete len:606 (-),score=122.80 TRINITY_DN9214_c0_g1_i1:166-1983(-)